MAVARMAAWVALLAALAIVLPARADYAVQWVYANTNCASPANNGVFQQTASCQAAPCTTIGGASTKTTCANDLASVIPSDRSQGTFLVEEIYSGSSCSGASIGGQFMQTDKCIPTGPSSYSFYTCNGGTATIKACSDSACSSCQASTDYSVNKCEAANGGSSKVYCSAAASHFVSAAAVLAVVAAIVMSLAF